MAKTPKTRSGKYKQKLELDKTVEFDDLFKVAINHNPKKKAEPTKKPKRKS